MVADQGVLKVSHGVQGPCLNQERARMEGLIKLYQDNRDILIKTLLV